MNDNQYKMFCRVKEIWCRKSSWEINTAQEIIDKLYNILITRDNESPTNLKEDIESDIVETQTDEGL